MDYVIIALMVTYIVGSLYFRHERLLVLEDISDALDDLVVLGIEKRDIECRNIKNGRWTDEPYIGDAR